MRLTPYLSTMEGLSPAGLVIAGAIAGAIAAPYLKKGLKKIPGGLSNNFTTAGHRLKKMATSQTKWWNGVVSEAKSRRKTKMSNTQARNKPILKFGAAGDF